MKRQRLLCNQGRRGLGGGARRDADSVAMPRVIVVGVRLIPKVWTGSGALATN